jgi:hypothetical protein
MKKTKISLKSALVLSASLFLFSCVPETETPLIQEDLNLVEELNTPTSGEENLRKDFQRNYFEKFDNILTEEEVLPENGDPIPQIYYPGTGSGNSSHMGKALTFINQLAQFGPYGLETIAAPVTMYHKDALYDPGITIPDDLEVSSVTTDGKGNSVWFISISNKVSFNEKGTRADFVAQVKIVGGSGKFEDAKGDGEVIGFFIPGEPSKGSSVIRGRITY